MNINVEITQNELSHYNSLKKQDIEHRTLIKKLQNELNQVKNDVVCSAVKCMSCEIDIKKDEGLLFCGECVK